MYFWYQENFFLINPYFHLKIIGMNKLTIFFAILIIIGCSHEEKVPENIIEMTEKILEYESRLVKCDSLESCEKISSQVDILLNDMFLPENYGHLCYSNSECFEAANNLTEYILSKEYFQKISNLMDESS